MAALRDKGILFYEFQADNQRRKQAIATYDSRASSSKATSKQNPKLLKSLGPDNLEETVHHPKLRTDALPTISFLF